MHDNKVVSVALSIAKSKTAIDIEIQTHEDYKRKGLATATGAQLVLSCIKKEISPVWLAANPESEQLACKLGYVKTGKYQSLFIKTDEE